MIDILVIVLFGAATATWRWWGGSDRRWPKSNLYGIALCLAAGAWASQLQLENWPVAIPTVVAAWLTLRGMPGWEHWLPNRNAQGKKRSGMLLGFALPTLLAGAAYAVLTGDWHLAIPYSISGLLLAAVYVVGTDQEDNICPLPFFPAEQWGRLSYSFITAGVAAL